MLLAFGLSALLPFSLLPWAQDTYGGTNDNGVPQYNTCLANKLGNRVKFTEEAFDWDFMAYFFYPYFWAHQSRWTELYRRDDTDTQFLNFLKAGYARVVIPVKPGYEKRAMHFLSNGGTIVPEGNLPVLPAEIYTNILDDLAQNYDTEVMLTEQIWQSVVPTNLVVMHCQSACMEWNDIRDEVGTCSGVYDNPVDLTPKSWTVMRFAEVE